MKANDEAGASRPAWKVERVAIELDCDPSTVRKLIKRGRLEGYRFDNKRALRVFADSVARFRDEGAFGRAHAPPIKAVSLRTDARHAAAVERLRKRGLL